MADGSWSGAPVPGGDAGLPGGHPVLAGPEVGAGLQAEGRELQAHEAELHLAARAQEVLTAAAVVLQQQAAGGAGPHGGAFSHAQNIRQRRGLTALQQLQILIGAALVVAAIAAGPGALPALEALPAELVEPPRLRCAHRALHTQIAQVLPLNTRLAARALRETNT